jgi:hypothetical protein
MQGTAHQPLLLALLLSCTAQLPEVVPNQTKHTRLPLLHICQELVQLPKLLKVDCSAACLVVYADNVSNCCQAEVKVAKLQRCLQLHCCQLIVAIFVNCIKPLQFKASHMCR